MGFWSLFVVALNPVLKVLLVTLVGLVLALERINVLGPTARTVLNHIFFYVFSPAMVAAYLADTVTWESIVQMWFMPINILLTFIVGSGLGWLLLKVTKASPHLHGLVNGCCAAGNLGTLLLVMIPAICDESNSPFGDSSTCTSDGDAYASLSMAIGTVYIWSYVYVIIKVSNDRSKQAIDNASLSSSARASSDPILDPLLSIEDQQGSSHKIDLLDDQIEEQVSLLEKIKQMTIALNLHMIFTPSVIAAIIGFIIGVVSPLRELLIGDSAPLRSIYGACYLIGEAAIPSTTLIIGANLLQGLKSPGVSPIIVIGVLVVRYVALPGVGILIVKGAHYFGWVGSDPLYQFVLLLQFALPPAMSVGTITQLFEMGLSDCSVIMLWAYSVAAISLTVWSTVFMSMVS